MLAPSDENTYRDTLFDFGKTYAYIVRSVVLVDGNALESSDSNAAIVSPRDTFPPAAPQNLVAAVLSWRHAWFRARGPLVVYKS